MASDTCAHTFLYSGIERCVQAHIMHFNVSTWKAAKNEEVEDCTICHEPLATNHDRELAVSTLPKCEHRFHEYCAMQWLSPIKLPITGPIAQYPASQVPSNENGAGDSEDDQECTPRGVDVISKVNRMTELGIDFDNAASQVYGQLRRLDRQIEDLVQRRRDVINLEPNGSPEGQSQGQYEAIVDALPLIQPPDQRVPLLSESEILRRRRARSNHCPLCRGAVFHRRSICYSDTIQLLRVRCRLTDLAYAFLGRSRDEKEERTRTTVLLFLRRRHADALAHGEQEITPPASDCELIFHHARYIIRHKAYKNHREPRIEQDHKRHLQNLSSLLKHFTFKEIFIPFFFDSSSKYDTKIKIAAESRKSLKKDPERLSKILEEHLRKLTGVTLRADSQEAVAKVQDEDVNKMDLGQS
ncbi:MAG: hypothetical protein L6R41_001285 [Letrouitia leprolyta]|nr:MAG: hypothetical protein L6R41_001285 [Letrouitia leprolyta]